MRGVDLDPAFGHRSLESGAANIGQRFDRLAGGQPVGDLCDLALAVAKDQQVGFGVQQGRAPDLFRPVVVVGDTAQARLDAADDDRHVFVGFPGALAVDQHAAVGSLPAFAAGRVGIVAAHLPVRGVAVDHGVHVAGRDAEEQVGRPEHLEGVGALPVRLSDDADAETLGFQEPAHHCHAEARMVDVGVAGHDDDVAAVPAERVHLRPGHGQHRRRGKPLGPVLAVTEQRCWCLGAGLRFGHSGSGVVRARSLALSPVTRR